VLCCYLFAKFTMKEEAAEGLTPAQLEHVNAWRTVLTEITVQEMLHLAVACNLLTAVGGSPQLRRPNLPTSPKAYPPAFELSLVPFGMEALDQFVFLERPEVLDTATKAAPSYRDAAIPAGTLRDAFVRERSYSTLGELYRGIEDGLEYLAQKLGEERLFIGRPAMQTVEPYFHLPGLFSIVDLASAQAALNVIIEQGEGASPDALDSHYRRFLAMRDEYRELKSQDPEFQPGRPVLVNPYALLPADLAAPAHVSIIDDPVSVDMAALFDGCYELMIQLLGRLFVHAEESEAELSVLSDISIGMMIEVVDVLGRAVTRLPAGRSHPGLNAGPSFRLSRGAGVPTHKDPARFAFQERLLELAAYCQFLQSAPPVRDVLPDVRKALQGFADQLSVSTV
jgi:hypothetical protein